MCPLLVSIELLVGELTSIRPEELRGPSKQETWGQTSVMPCTLQSHLDRSRNRHVLLNHTLLFTLSGFSGPDIGPDYAPMNSSNDRVKAAPALVAFEGCGIATSSLSGASEDVPA